MQMLKRSFLALALAGVVIFSSCKKETSGEDAPDRDSTATISLIDKIKDTSLAYSRDLYLWYTQIPGTFNARSYADPNKLMEAIRQYSKETGFTDPVDRWSFAVKQKEWDDISSGIAGDFGLNVFFRSTSDLRVRYVEKESPAGKAGIRRGWRITKVNGSTNIATSNSSTLSTAIYQSQNTSFEFQKPDGTTVPVSLAAATYKENPIFLDTVYTASAGKVGYLVFNSFLGDTAQIYNNFQQIFSRFSAENVKDVIVDLRYNGGGYVSVQEKLANYLVKSSASGSLMMKEIFNNKYQNFNETINFSKLGSLNANRLFFIVSDNTASASELLINNLKPYAEVRLVGPTNTYGKPVGYFPLEVGDWYIFPVSFRSTNKDGQGNYFGGIPTDSKSADGTDQDWGNINEASLKNVLSYINTGAYAPSSTVAPMSTSSEVTDVNKQFSNRSFKGAVIRPKTLKP